MIFFDIIRRLRCNIVVVAFVCVIFNIAFGQVNQEGSYLHIIQPRNLKEHFGPNGVDENPALFGTPQYGYGTKITGLLVFPQNDNLLACNPIDKKRIFPPWPSNGVIIIVVDRGNCTFVTKVKHCEDAGANAVIIVNNVYSQEVPYMDDDYSGRSLTIPSMFIHKSDGDLIKNEMLLNTTVVVTMSWHMPSPDNRVEWEIWTSSDDDIGLQFKKGFKTVAESLGDSVFFTPHYFFRDGARIGCTTPSLPCYNQCTNSGKYCSIDPDHDLAVGISGADVIQENLRQQCLWKHLNETGKNIQWWDYTVKFEDVCNNKEDPSVHWNKDCSQQLMRELGIDYDAVFQCVNKSGGAEYIGGDNNILHDSLSLRYERQIFYLPTVIINGIHYRGSLLCPEPIDVTTCGVLQTICAGYKVGTAPDACLSAPGCGVGIERDVCGVCDGNGTYDSCRRCLSVDDPNFQVNGAYDDCGQCLVPGDKEWNKSCMGCDGIVGSSAIYDPCGDCMERDDPKWGQACAIRSTIVRSLPIYVYILIVAGALLIAGIFVFRIIRARERRMQRNIDQLLSKYLPLKEDIGNDDNSEDGVPM